MQFWRDIIILSKPNDLETFYIVDLEKRIKKVLCAINQWWKWDIWLESLMWNFVYENNYLIKL